MTDNHITEFQDNKNTAYTLKQQRFPGKKVISIKANKMNLKRFDKTFGWQNIETEQDGNFQYSANTEIQLNQDTAQELLPYLKTFAETGSIDDLIGSENFSKNERIKNNSSLIKLIKAKPGKPLKNAIYLRCLQALVFISEKNGATHAHELINALKISSNQAKTVLLKLQQHNMIFKSDYDGYYLDHGGKNYLANSNELFQFLLQYAVEEFRF